MRLKTVSKYEESTSTRKLHSVYVGLYTHELIALRKRAPTEGRTVSNMGRYLIVTGLGMPFTREGKRGRPQRHATSVVED